MGLSSTTELSVPSLFNFGFALANDLKMLEDSFLSVAGPGAGVDSLLEGLLVAVVVVVVVVVVLVFSFPLPKNSFAVEGCALDSGLGFAAGVGTGALDADAAGTGAAAAVGS
jgi:hypothetical protein